MPYQNTDPNILDSMPGYDVYGFPTGAFEEVEELTHNGDFEDPDGFPCRCGASNCPDGGLNSNPYV